MTGMLVEVVRGTIVSRLRKLDWHLIYVRLVVLNYKVLCLSAVKLLLISRCFLFESVC